MNIIVTGGLGFIGSEFVKYASDQGAHCTVIDNMTYAADKNRLNGIAEYWNSDGTRKKSGKFKNGSIIGDWTYHTDFEVNTD